MTQDRQSAPEGRRIDSLETLAARLTAAEPSAARRLSGLVGRLRNLDPEVRLAAGGAGDPWVRGVVSDSRDVTPGVVFVAVPGEHVDGHDFIADALRAGAAAVLAERPGATSPAPTVLVRSARRALAEAAAWWYADPARELGVIGITGTDGKTTTALLAAAALAAAGLRPGIVSTVATQIGGVREPNPVHSTTPEAPRLQAALRAMVAAGDDAAIIETTSHGLALDRVAAIGYDVAILTNLTHEHLELHGTFEAYRAAKRSLFERLAVDPSNPPKAAVAWPRTGIVNADDPSAPVFAAATREAGARLVTYGRADDADVRLREVGQDEAGIRVTYRSDGREAEVLLRLGGSFNAWNALAVVGLGSALGLDPAAVRAGLESVTAVPGRMERVALGQAFDVVVDYAHSPASLALVLDEQAAVAGLRGGSILAVFGSAGERDTAKRAVMGRLAADRCRVVILTDEDPRGEDRAAIVAEIAAGARTASRTPEAVLEIVDRRAAIREAMARARPGDVVVLAGKGHETSIIQAHGPEPWDELAEAEAALIDLGLARSTPR
jgi:UDP-N-acetylmuramoyl-L-alanyl-D-glutamate--2,6-diaminopimelate ligase